MRKQYKHVLSPEARRQIKDILQYSKKEFGAPAEKKYRNLIEQSLSDIEQNPYRLESKNRNELGDDHRSVHIPSSKQHISGETVKNPRHSIVYEIQDDKIEVLGVFHDSQDIKRHLPKEQETAQQHQSLKQVKDDEYER